MSLRAPALQIRMQSKDWKDVCQNIDSAYLGRGLIGIFALFLCVLQIFCIADTLSVLLLE